MDIDELMEAQHLFWMGRDGNKNIKQQLKEFEKFLQEIKDGKRRIKKVTAEGRMACNRAYDQES